MRQLKRKKELLLQLFFFIVSLIVAMAVILHRAIGYPDGLEFLKSFQLAEIFTKPLFYVTLLAMFLICNLLSYAGSKWLAQRNCCVISASSKPAWLIFLMAFIPLLCASLLCFAIYYPATGMIDSQYVLVCGTMMYKQHPYWYCLLYNKLFILAQSLFSDTYLHYAFVCIVQFLAIDAALAGTAVYVRQKCGLRLFVLYILYLSCLPIIALYSITLVKDALYSVAILWLTLWMHTLIESKGEKAPPLLCFLVFFAVCASRNNGKYILFIIVPLLVLVFRNRRLFLLGIASLALTIILCVVPNKILDVTAPSEELYQEKVGIPLQQLAATYVCGGAFDEQDIAYMDKIFELEALESEFDPYDIDAVKWGGTLDNAALSQSTGDFWERYIHIFFNNIELFVKEWLLATYGYWDGDNYLNYSQSSMFTIYKSSGITNRSLLPDTLTNLLDALYHRFARFFTGGECLLAVLTFVLLLIRTDRSMLILLCLPVLLNTLSLFAAAPIAMGYRYILPYAYVAPFLFVFLIPAGHNDEK